jgi:hypothetical protein
MPPDLQAALAWRIWNNFSGWRGDRRFCRAGHGFVALAGDAPTASDDPDSLDLRVRHNGLS